MPETSLQRSAKGINYAACPADLEGSFRRYFENGISPGHFLTAVLENNLKEAMGRADYENRARLFDIVAFLYNAAPAPSWGSPELVAAFLSSFKTEESNA